MTETYEMEDQVEERGELEGASMQPRFEQATQNVDVGMLGRIDERVRDDPRWLIGMLLASWGVLIGRFLGETEVSLNVRSSRRLTPPIAHRQFIRIELSEELTMGGLLAQTVKALSAAVDGPTTEGAFADMVEVSAEHSEAHLQLNLTVRSLAHVTCAISCLRPAQEDGYVARLMESWHVLLLALANTPEVPVSRLPLASEAVRQRVLRDFNQTAVEFPEQNFIHELIEHQAAHRPTALALVYGTQRLDYAGLNRWANQLAHYLHLRGVSSGSRVGLCLDRGVEMVVGMLAVLKAGGAYVPLDPAYPPARLQQMLEDAAPGAVLTQARLRAKFHQGSVPLIEFDGEQDAIASQSAENIPAASLGLTARSLAYVIYTSGSTGRPKGAMNDHRGMVNRIVAARDIEAFDAADICCQKTSISYVDSVFEAFGPLSYGLPLVIASADELKDLQALAALIEKERVTRIVSVPSVARVMLEDAQAMRQVAGLRSWTLSGEAVQADLLQQLHRHLPGCEFIIQYGSSEVSSDAAIYKTRSNDEDAVPLGRPIANARVYVLDAYAHPVPIGAVGEIYVGGVGVGHGYLNRAELTAARFVCDPFSADRTEDRMYRTGDLGRWRSDGMIEYLGRNDHQIKIRGMRVELGEIESALYRCDDVREAVVVAREVEAGEKRLVAYVALRQSDGAVERIKEQLNGVLPNHMVPSAVVVLASLPRTPNGKVDRLRLPTTPLEREVSSAQESDAPRGEAELTLASIWRDLLKVQSLSREANFFELGGHSQLIARLLARLRAAGWSTGVQQIYDSPSLATLGKHLVPYRKACEMPADASVTFESVAALSQDGLAALGLNEQQLTEIACTVSAGVANIEDLYPLSPMQEGLLFQHLLNEGGDDAYVTSTLLRVDSSDRLQQLVAALQRMVDRYDVLRTSVLWQGLPRPMQVVWRRAALPVQEVPADTQTAPRMTLDLSNAPLMRLQVSQEPDDAWQVRLDIDHIIIDDVSLKRLTTEIVGELTGAAALVRERTPYKQHVLRALEQARGAEKYFREKLSDIEEPTAPFGLLDVRGDGSNIDESRLGLDAQVAARIQRQARRLGVSPATLFHAGWALVLAHTTGRDDVVFGTVLLGRLQGDGDADEAVGMFINTLPLRLRLRELTAAELVRHTRCELAGVLNHEQAPLTLAQRCSGLESGVPLFSSILNYRQGGNDASRDWAHVPGIQVQAIRDRTNYPVTVCIDALGEGFELTMQTADRVSSRRLAAFFTTALTSLAAALEEAPGTQALALPALPPSEREQILRGFNDTYRPYPAGTLIHHLVEAQVARTPHATALSYGDVRLTYVELNAKANQLARFLRSRGVGADQLVGVCTERSIEMVIALLGILKAGGAYVPLDPTYPTDRLKYMLQDSAPAIVLTLAHLKESVLADTPHSIALDRDWSSIARFDASNLFDVELTDQQLAYVIYTSGSTGQPKGAMNEHRAVVNRIRWMQDEYGIGARDRVLQKTPYSFDVSVWEFFWTLMSGAELVVARPQGHQDPGYLREVIQSRRVTTAHFVPSMLEIFLAQEGIEGCTTLKLIVCSGEEFPIHLQNRCLERLPGARLANLYGPTEAAVDVTYWECRPEAERARVPIGRPIANVQMYVLSHCGQPAPIGVAGEIFIGGVGVGRGYWRRAQLTADRFIPDPHRVEDSARLYKTGDQGCWREDGTIEYLGRNDHQVKIRGLRIELGEIESRLRSYSSIKDAVVLARSVRGEKQLIAYVVREPARVDDAAADTKALRAYLGAHLPAYMVPSAFVVLDRMPLSPNGKLDRRALPEPAAEAYSHAEYEPPEGEIETLLARIWEQVLQIPRVGRRDNFFELGGHSLLVVQVMELLRRAGFAPALREVLDSASLGELADKLSVTAAPVQVTVVPPNRIPTPCDCLTPQMLPLVDLNAEQLERIIASVPGGVRNIQDIYPLTPLQEGLLFHHTLSGEQRDAYVVPTLLRLPSRGYVERLIIALQSTIARHDVLRTAILWEDLAQPVQVVYRQAELPVQELAFDPLLDHAQRCEQWMCVGAERLDLRRAPLMQLGVAEDTHSGECYALLRLHHIVGDDLSQEIIVSEVVAHFKGEPLPERASVAYREHVAQALANARSRNSEQFFLDKLADVDEPTAPFGMLDTQGDGTLIEEAHLELPAALCESIRAQAKRLGVSSAALFHAGWGLVIAATSGRDDVVFGTVLLGRLQGDVGAQRVLGMFINTLPLRLKVAGASAKELTLQAHRDLIGLLEHEQAPLAMAQRCSSVPGGMPLFSALLNYRHRDLEHSFAWDSVAGIEVVADRDLTNYPFTMSVNDTGAGFELTAHVHRRITAERVNGYMLAALQALVHALEHEPDAVALRLSVLPAQERHQLTVAFNATDTDARPHALVHELFEERALHDPDAVALIQEGQTLTYAELNAAANRLACYLLARGSKPGDRVALVMSRSLQLVLAQLAVLKSGGVYVPIDPALPLDRKRFILSDCGAYLGLLERASIGGLEDMGVQWIDPESAHEAISALSVENLNVSLAQPAAAYVMYTSGSTGAPKGVLIAHRGINRLVLECGYAQLSAEDCIAHCSNPAFDASTFEIWSALLHGARLLIVPHATVLEAPALARSLVEHRVTILFLTTGLFTQHAEALAPVLPQLRYLFTGGDVLEPAIARRVLRRTPPRHFMNAYGPTECTTYATTHLIEQVDEDAQSIPIGRPISNTQVYILNSAGGLVPIGAEGEIYVGGAGVALGYLNRPEQTEQRFVADSFRSEPGARLYRTGDKGRWLPNGVIEFRGRIDDQVKVRGFRIEPGEIEAQLLREPVVKDAVVLARGVSAAEKRLVGYVVTREPLAQSGDKTALLSALRESLKERLPEYMIPSSWMVMDKLPITANGKVDRRALPAPTEDAVLAGEYVAPETELERNLALSWAALLGLERVDVNSNFFELGGHSLSALKLVADVSGRVGVAIPVVTVFRSPTIKQMALAIESLRQPSVAMQKEMPSFEEGAL